jgi:CP family cyanate transporter-like MFS transporter
MRFRDQRAIGLAIVAAAVLGFVGMVLGPLPAVWVCAALQGLGQGGALAVAMTLIILRSPDSRIAAHLSSMAQSVGYTVAAFGPLVMGFIRQASGGFGATIWLILAVGGGCAYAMLGAGRPRHVLAGRDAQH